MLDTKGQTVTLPRELEAGASERRVPALFLVMRCDQPLAPGSAHLLDSIAEVRIGRGETQRVRVEAGALVIELHDAAVSSDHARIVRRGGVFRIEDQQSKNGTCVDGERIAAALLSDGALIEVGHQLLAFRAAVRQSSGVEEAVRERLSQAGLTTLSFELAERFATAATLAPTARAILIAGPTGSGKEVAARALHELSGRRGAFVPVNCAALPDPLLESELFGYVRGAFSGAVQDRSGLVAAAHGGTLFLDEVAELSPRGQAALLRTLQEGEVRPVGATHTERVDLCVVAASHRDLRALVAAGEFREDLLARICGFELELPPLAERREDLGLLVGRLLARVAGERAGRLGIAPRAARALWRHRWPQNVREIEHALRVATTLAIDDVLTFEHLPEEVRRALVSAPPASAPAAMSPEDAALRERLATLLAAHHGNVSRVAEAMGRKRQQIQKWCRRLELDAERFRSHR